RRRPTSAGLRAVDLSAIPVPISSPPSGPLPHPNAPVAIPTPPSAPIPIVTAPGRPPLPPPLPALPRATPTLGQFPRRRLIPPDPRALPCETAAGQALIVRVRGKVYPRTEGVLVSGGELTFAAARRRSRGRVTDEPFGTVQLVSGAGHLVALPRGGVFATMALDDDVIYLREELVFAFEERLSWENGHGPGSNGALPVVQLRRARRPAVRP